MIFTTPMRLLAAVVLDKSSEDVSRELLRLGTLELISVRDLASEWKDRVGPLPSDGTEARIEELRRRLEGLLRIPGNPIRLPVPSLDDRTPLDLAAAEKTLDALAAEIGSIRDRQKAAQEDILRLSEMRRQLEVFDDLSKPSGLGSAYSFLAIRTGSVPSSRLPALEEALAALPSVLVPWGDDSAPSRNALVVTLKRDEGRVAPILSRAGWEDGIPAGDSRDAPSRDGKVRALQGIDARVADLRERQKAYQSELEELFRKRGPELESMWTRLRLRELLGRVKSRFARTERTVLFSGWIPADAAQAVEEGIRKATGGRCHIEWISEKEVREHNQEAPVDLKNPRLLRPFEALVRNYAVPEYGSVNPVPFTAAAYLVMFGLMFGDTGHGLVLALLGGAGVLAARRSEKDDTLARLILYCGFSAIVAGILFGSYFGMPWLPPVWFNYHGIVTGREAGEGSVRTVYDILGITIKFGLAVLGTGLVLNWINLIRRKRWLTLALDKGGLLGGWIYGAGAWAAFLFVGSGYRTLPDPDLLFWILGLPTLILALKGPAEYFLHPPEHRKPFGALTIVDFFMEWIVEVLEIYSGYLANTLSFMRVAGLGIAHVSLMTAFFQIARMLNPSGGFSAAAVAVLTLGNILVIALEGLSAGIQSLRLNYYEFFSKYFNGTGRAFRPISLGTRE